MVYRGFQNIKVSALGFGAMRLPTIGDEWNSPIDDALAGQKVDYTINKLTLFGASNLYNSTRMLPKVWI